MRFIIFVVIILYTTVYPQIVSKVLVSGIAGYEEHDEEVKNAFLKGYSSYSGEEFQGIIELYPENLSESFKYAELNGFDMIIRSTTGLSTGIYYAEQYPNIKLVMPSGSNSFILTYSGDIETCPVIVTGAGIDKNVTGYKIDFYSIDPITNYNYSSFSNGYIAGQIAYIANRLNCSIEEARIKAREKGTQKGEWDEYNGYGKINIEATIENVFPVELTSFTANLTGAGIVLSWQTATEVNNYGFQVERKKEKVEGIWETIGFIEGHGNSNSPQEYSFVDNSAVGSVSYRLKQIDIDGGYEYSDVVTVNGSLVKTELFQNYPNPFNPSTQISFALAKAGAVNVSVYNTLGQKVAELVNQKMDAGMHSVEFNASNLASGFYFYILETPNYSKTMKMILLR